MNVGYLWMRFRMKYFPFTVKNKDFVAFLRKKGVEIGEGTYFFSPATVCIDLQRPWMISIGSYCKITSGVIILQHDYSRSVIRRVYGQITPESKKTTIGDNVFIGMNTIILMGTKIGNNVIIGAGSVVRGVIPDNVVAAGNPAKIICTLDDYYHKRMKSCLEEGLDTAREYKKSFGRNPTIQDMGAFFVLFGERSRNYLKNNNIFTKYNGDDQEDLIEKYLLSHPVYSSFDEFLKFANEKDKTEND